MCIFYQNKIKKCVLKGKFPGIGTKWYGKNNVYYNVTFYYYSGMCGHGLLSS